MDELLNFNVMDLIVKTTKRVAADQKRSCGYAPYIQLLINSKVGSNIYLLEHMHLPLDEDCIITMDSADTSSAASQEQAESARTAAEASGPNFGKLKEAFDAHDYVRGDDMDERTTTPTPWLTIAWQHADFFPGSLEKILGQVLIFLAPPPPISRRDCTRSRIVAGASPRSVANPGDWDCRSCQHLNFSRRDLCQRCGEPRSAADRGSVGGALGGDYANFGGRGGGGSSFGTGFGAGSDVRPGDWYCTCGAHNFASRSSCFKCAAFKEEAAVNGGAGGFDGDMSRSRGFGFGAVGGMGGGMGAGAAGGRASRPGWKSGDWICTRSGCNEHNFASRQECFRCNAPRDSGTEV
ncbi:RNA-binding protein EWS [Triticum aestivum]|uniref:RNA-binding protein EWS n=1 Tax=Triticum aestivum TaxID=4565 RepID=UPI001D028E9D|nr:RNA-binding protein EWS-like [Triticum aestivum]